jgi:hypothetical protein
MATGAGSSTIEIVERQRKYNAPWNHQGYGRTGGSYDPNGPAFVQSKATDRSAGARKNFTSRVMATNIDPRDADGHTRDEKYKGKAHGGHVIAFNNGGSNSLGNLYQQDAAFNESIKDDQDELNCAIVGLNHAEEAVEQSKQFGQYNQGRHKNTTAAQLWDRGRHKFEAVGVKTLKGGGIDPDSEAVQHGEVSIDHFGRSHGLKEKATEIREKERHVNARLQKGAAKGKLGVRNDKGELVSFAVLSEQQFVPGKHAADLDTATVPQLQELLQNRGLGITGKKGDLMLRLKNHKNGDEINEIKTEFAAIAEVAEKEKCRQQMFKEVVEDWKEVSGEEQSASLLGLYELNTKATWQLADAGFVSGSGITKQTTEKSFCSIGFEKTETGKGSINEESGMIEMDKVESTSVRLNEETKRSMNVGLSTANMKQTVKNEQQFSRPDGLDVLCTAGTETVTAIGMQAAGDVFGRMVGCGDTSTNASGARMLRSAYEESRGESLGDRVLSGANGALNQAGRELQNQLVPSIPSINERNSDGSMKRMGLGNGRGDELSFGTKEKIEQKTLKDGSVQTRHRTDTGVQARVDGARAMAFGFDQTGATAEALSYVPALNGLLSVSVNVGTSTETLNRTKNDLNNFTQESFSQQDVLTGIRSSIDVLGWEVVDRSTGKLHTVCTTEKRRGIDMLDCRYRSQTSKSGMQLLGYKCMIDTGAVEASSVKFCGFEYAQEVTSTGSMWASQSTSECHKMTLLFASAEVVRDRDTGECASWDLSLQDEGVVLLGQCFSSAVADFSRSIREGKQFNAAVGSMVQVGWRTMGVVTYDMILTDVSMKLCDEITAQLNMRLERVIRPSAIGDEWIERVTPAISVGISSLVRPLVDAIINGFDAERFRGQYFKSLILNSIVTVLKLSGQRTLVMIVQGIFSTVYDKWFFSEGNVFELIFDLAPAIIEALAKSGACASLGPYEAVAKFALSYFLCPLLAEILKTRSARALVAALVGPLQKELSTMKDELGKLSLGEKGVIVTASGLGALGAGGLASTATTTAAMATTVPSAALGGWAGWAGLTSEVTVTTTTALCTPMGAVAIGVGAAVVVGAAAAYLVTKHKQQTRKDWTEIPVGSVTVLPAKLCPAQLRVAASLVEAFVEITYANQDQAMIFIEGALAQDGGLEEALEHFYASDPPKIEEAPEQFLKLGEPDTDVDSLLIAEFAKITGASTKEAEEYIKSALEQSMPALVTSFIDITGADHEQAREYCNMALAQNMDLEDAVAYYFEATRTVGSNADEELRKNARDEEFGAIKRLSHLLLPDEGDDMLELYRALDEDFQRCVFIRQLQDIFEQQIQAFLPIETVIAISSQYTTLNLVQRVDFCELVFTTLRAEHGGEGLRTTEMKYDSNTQPKMATRS